METKGRSSIALQQFGHFNRWVGYLRPRMQPESPSAEGARAAQEKQIRANIRHIQHRQWWLWSSAVLVTMLLALGIASFAFPGLLAQSEDFSFYIGQAVRGLVCLDLAYNVPL